MESCTKTYRSLWALVLLTIVLVQGADRWDSHLLNYLKEFNKGPRSTYSSSSRQTLKDCKEYIVSKFNVGFDLDQTFKQDFTTKDTNDGKEVSGTNVIGILKGKNYDTPEDKILILGAHYDTRKPVAGGVVNDGSGVTAVLRAAEIFSKQKKEFSCVRNHSIIFVAFDQGETESEDSTLTTCNKSCGSQEFLKQLTKYTGSGTVQGVIIMDCIMNFDEAKNSQKISKSLEEYFTAAGVEKLSDSQGWYLVVFGREDEKDMISRLGDLFPKNQPGGMSLQKYPLRFSGNPTSDNLTEIKKFFKLSDQLSFWESANPQFKSVLLTDTCYDRGFMRECKNDKSCDTLENIQNDLKSLSFMQAIISTVLTYANEVTEGCPDVDNCETGSHMCAADAMCQDLFGSYHCQCKNGFEGSGFSCSDIDECKESPCTMLQTEAKKCVNTRGSYKCVKDNSAHSMSISLLASLLTVVIGLLLS